MKVKIGKTVRDMKAVWFENNIIKLIDQCALPKKLRIYEAKDYKNVIFAINEMVVRGAPAIGVTAAYALAQASLQKKDVKKVAALLQDTRPTANDLYYAIEYMLKNIERGEDPVASAEAYAQTIIEECRRIGSNGERLIKNGDKILTHCNAGALATVDYGTALAPIRFAFDKGKDIFVFVDETRPRLQGGKLTSWELLQEGIPHAVIADNAAGYFLWRKEIDIVITGADRVAANGDAANKIGTYEKAILAKENGIPFYITIPRSSFDIKMETGNAIPIEERDENEVLRFEGKRIAPLGASARNPAFDVTPAKYITGFITEEGILKPIEIRKLTK